MMCFSRGSQCQRSKLTVVKKSTAYSACPHELIVMLLKRKVDNCAEEFSDDGSEKPTSLWLENTARYRYRNQKLYFQSEKQKEIEKTILEISKQGWPDVFQVSMSYYLYLV